MRILVIGGTQFVGFHMVERALERGHHLTLFNRGRTNPKAWPSLVHLKGDRDGGLDILKGRRWDRVLDTCGYLPRVVRQSVELLREAAPHYTFISSESVYRDLGRPGINERSAVGRLADESVEEITGDTYGPLKALCETVVRRALPRRSLIIRPGYVVGPGDHSDRFTRWVRRVAEGGDVLAPGDPNRAIQFVDARDLADWTIRMMEMRGTGTFNASGPEYDLSFRRFFETCRRVSGSRARFVWVPDAALVEAGVSPEDLPLWEPPAPGQGADMAVDSSRAVAAGLKFRPLARTIRDTLEWDRHRPANKPRKKFLSRAREARIVAAWLRRR